MRGTLLRPVVTAVIMGAGAHLVLRMMTGRGLVARARARLAPAARAPLTPPSDPVDEASWESFPASDPPATGNFGTPPARR